MGGASAYVHFELESTELELTVRRCEPIILPVLNCVHPLAMDYFSYGFALIVLGGGIMGFVKAGEYLIDGCSI